jgi:hypothetical protein
MRQIVKKTAIPNKFTLHWQDIPNSQLIIDFNPLIDIFRLTGHFVLLHYQARPVGLRRFGALYAGDYHSLDELEAKTPSRTLYLPEVPGMLPPNAVICYANSRIAVSVVDDKSIGTIVPI